MENFEDLDKPSIEFKNLIKIVQLAPQQWIIQVKICVCRGKNGAYLVYFPCILFVSWAASICPSLQVHSGSTGLSDNSAFVSLHSLNKMKNNDWLNAFELKKSKFMKTIYYL